MPDKKGSAELLAFLLVLPLLLVPIFNNIYAYADMNRYDLLKQAARESLLRMEIHGGLTQEDYDSILSYLEERNFDTAKLQVDYTPYPVDFGEEVAIRIGYEYTQSRFSLGLGGIKKTVSEEEMVYGPVRTTSKYYQR
jgi:hypothetical protein